MADCGSCVYIFSMFCVFMCALYKGIIVAKLVTALILTKILLILYSFQCFIYHSRIGKHVQSNNGEIFNNSVTGNQLY